MEGKLPISLADGQLKPIEMTFKVMFDPNTSKVDIVQDNGEVHGI